MNAGATLLLLLAPSGASADPGYGPSYFHVHVEDLDGAGGDADPGFAGILVETL